jgi:hypothetical protein
MFYDYFNMVRHYICLNYDKGFTKTFWTQTIAMGLCDKGFANTLWTQTIVMGPYDKGFTNNF